MSTPRAVPSLVVAPVRFGVKARLWAALIALAVAPALAGGPALYGLRQVAAALSDVADLDLPKVAAALKLSAQGERMVTVGPTLANVTSLSDQDDLRETFQELESEAAKLADGLAGQGVDVTAIRQALAAFNRNFQQIDELVQRRLTVRKELGLTQRTVADLAQMVGLGVEGAIAHTADPDALRRLARLGAGAAKLQAAFLALSNARSTQALPPISRTMTEEIAAMTQAVDGAPAAVKRDLKPSVEFWAQQVAADPARAQGSLIALDDAQPGLLEANRAAARALDQAIEALRTQIQAEAATAAAAGRGEAAASERILLVVVAIGVLFALALGWFYVDRRVARRLVQLQQAMLAAARGDMTRPLPDGMDEIGGMAQALAIFKRHAEQLAHQRAAMIEHAEQVADASRQALIAAAQVAETAQAQRDALDQVAGAVAESTKGVGEVSDASRTADDRARASATAARQGLEAIRGLDVLALRLGDNAQQVGGIAEAIADIAAKTNMLSLNASIEAARAGEGGKGFSVVAQRVRKLAEEAAEAAEQIAGIVQRAGADAQAERDTAQSCIGLMERIAAVSGETGGMVRAIAVAMSQQQAAMQSADEAVKGLRQLAFANAAAAEEISMSVARLSRLAETARMAAQG